MLLDIDDVAEVHSSADTERWREVLSRKLPMFCKTYTVTPDGVHADILMVVPVSTAMHAHGHILAGFPISEIPELIAQLQLAFEGKDDDLARKYAVIRGTER